VARPGQYKSEKRKKEMKRQKKQEEKRQKRTVKDPAAPEQEPEIASQETAPGNIDSKTEE
jgi:hypothetical protein